MSSWYKWRYYCVTEDDHFYQIFDNNVDSPTVCINNSLDEIDTKFNEIVDIKSSSVISAISMLNSTQTPLTSSSTFTGTWEDITLYSNICITCNADTFGLLYIDFSSDSTNVDVTTQLSDGLSALNTYSTQVVAKYYRIRLENNTVDDQTYLRVQTLLQKNSLNNIPTSKVSNSVTNFTDCINSRSALFGRHTNGLTYENINITGQNLLKVSLKEPQSSYSEIVTTTLNNRIQIDAVEGIQDVDVETITGGSGSGTVSNGCYVVSTGTTVGSYSTIRSKRLIRYMPGHGVRCRFSAKFTTGIASSVQIAGLSTGTEAVVFGYSGTTFGLARRIAGQHCILKLSFTVGTSGSETHTIVLNGVTFTYASSGTLSTQELAEDIADNKVFAGWRVVMSNGSDLMFGQTLPTTTSGSGSYSSTGTATGSVTVVAAGIANDIATGFVAKSSWNQDKMDGSNTSDNASGVSLDPTKLNIYEIVLSNGGIAFYIMDQYNELVMVHNMPYSGLYTTPITKNPSFRVAWSLASMGSTTDISCGGVDASAFIEGCVRPRRNPFSLLVSHAVSSSETIVFALRNRYDFLTVLNTREVSPLFFNTASDIVDDLVSISIYINPVTSGFMNWTYYNTAISSIDYSVPSSATITSGVKCSSYIIINSPSNINLKPMDIRIAPGDILCITAQSESLSGNIKCSLTWYEN
jgi:hypothetical protein